MQPDGSLSVIVAVVAGLFSLLGAFAGAWLARRTEYEKWLRQNRSEAFARFLTALAEARNCATDARFNTTLEPLERGIKMTECYLTALNYAQVVRLYLPRASRSEFVQLAEAYRAIHTDQDLNGVRYKQLDEQLARIQEIFEASLDS